MKLIISTVLMFFCWKAAASPATYTLSGTGTGSLGPTAFSDAFFTLTASADTSGVTESLGVFLLSNSRATVFVSGVGTATFTVPTTTVDNTAGGAGISAPDQNMTVLADFNSVFSSYDLAGSLAAVAGTPEFNPGTGFATTAGDFSLTSVSSLSFQAEVVPEPSALVLLGLAALGSVLQTRRNRV